MTKNKLLLLLVLLTMLSTRTVAQNDASAMREQMKTRIDELKALAPDNVKGLNETLKNDVKVYIAQYTEWYNASKSYDDYEEAYAHLGFIITRVNKYLAAYGEFTVNLAKLKDLTDNFNAGTEEKKQGYKTFAQNVYNAYKALSEHDMIALDDDDVEAQKDYDDNVYYYVPDYVTSDNIGSVADAAGNHEYISTYGQFNAFFSQNTKELGSIYLEVAGTATAESPENLTAQLRNPNLENAGEQWWGTDWTSIGNSAAEQSGKPFITYQQVHLPPGYYTLVGYGMDRRGSWADVLANDEDWNEDHRTYLFSHLDIDGSDSTMVDAFKAKNMALTADITEGAGNISTCEVDGVTYYTPNSMAQYRAWEDAKIAMAGQGHGAVVQFWVWQDEGDFGSLGFAHRWHVDNTWFVADGIQLYYAKDNFPNINIDTPDCASVTITNDGWATLYTDKALAFSGIKGLTAYTAKRDGSTVTLTPVDNVPANTGVVLKGDAKTYNIPIIASSTTDKGELQGSATTATAFDAHAAVGGIYVLGLNDKNEAQFEKTTSGNVPAGQPYLLVPTAEEPSSALRVVIAGETTPAAMGYSVTMAEGTEEADKWTVKVGEGEAQAFPVEGLNGGETVTVTYSGTKKVKSVKAVKNYAANEYNEGSWDGTKVVFTKKTAASEPTAVANSDAAVTWSAGWYTVSGNVTINGDVTLTADAHLILQDGAKLTINGKIDCNTNRKNLYIYGQKKGDGKLIVTNSDYGLRGSASTFIEIHGGEITATTQYNALYAKGVKVYGGKITATATGNSSCIIFGNGFDVYGGEIEATNTSTSMAYHGFSNGFPFPLTVYGGKVTATGNANGSGFYCYVKSGTSGIKFYFSDNGTDWDAGTSYASATQVGYAAATKKRYAKAE